VLALFLGLIVSAGLYFAYMWPSIEPLEEPTSAAGDSTVAAESSADKAKADDDEPASTASSPS